MSPLGRPKGSYRSTECEGTPVSADRMRDDPSGRDCRLGELRRNP
jgi:hypothetical protein